MNVWRPFPRQEFALLRSEFEVLMGGARGPGKTDTGIVWLLGDEMGDGKLYIHHPRYRALVIRKNADDLSDWLDRARYMFAGLNVSIAYKPAILRFPSGAVIRTGHLKDDQAYTKYQGHEYPRMLIEELTQIPDEKRYLQLISSCRSTITELRPQVFNTTNPGGIGHSWVKARFIDVAPPDTTYTDSEGNTRIFVPATLDDNPVLQEKDPGYIKRLDALKKTDEELWRAWRLGDWDVFAGQVFREFRREHHVIRPIVPKKSFTHIIGMDWGYSENSAFAAHLSAIIPMQTESGDTFNRVVTYKEWAGNQKTPEQWAKEIFTDVKKMGITISEAYTDPAMHNALQDGSVSIAEMMESEWRKLNFGENWLYLEKGNNNRVAGVATLHNWLSMAPDGKPYWVMTENCLNTIRTLPLLTYDERKPDDVATDGDDHWYDSCRYFLSQIRWIQLSAGGFRRTKAVVKLPKTAHMKDGGQVGLDSDDFAIARRK